MHPSPTNLILASSSPYRREILQRLGLTFESISPDIDENRKAGESAVDLVERLAISKASKVAQEINQGLVIGSDQVCLLSGQILGKPRDRDHAIRQLLDASGQQACLYNGLAVIDATSGALRSKVVTVEVTYRHLQQDEIERYLDADEPYQCCGSLKVESLGISLLSAIKSDDPNAITGMPVIALLDILRQFGAIIP